MAHRYSLDLDDMIPGYAIWDHLVKAYVTLLETLEEAEAWLAAHQQWFTIKPSKR